MSVSLAASLASLPPETQAAILADLTSEEAAALERDWRFWARPDQIAPEGDWDNWLLVAGRGSGKTRAGAEWIREQVMAGVSRIALVAPTAADVRDVMVKGESGLLSVCHDHDRARDGTRVGRPEYEPSKRSLTWANGAQALMFSAEEPERLRGPQFEIAWCDELAAWNYAQDTWDMLQFGLRLGERPRTVVTTTPKPVKIVRNLMADPGSVITRASTFDNLANLAPAFIRRMRARYEGTRLGQQELYAVVLDEAEGALWSRDMLDAAAFHGLPPEMKRIVVAIDPAVTAKTESDETGIVVAGLGTDDLAYVLEDASGRMSPADWARTAIALAGQYKADRIVAEVNNGGDMVEHTIRTFDRSAPFRAVHASRGKRARAEPVAALYEQGRVKHMRGLSDLETQLTTWEPLTGMASPDRLDALVWALTDLVIEAPATFEVW